MSGRDLVSEMREGGKVPRAPSSRSSIFDLLLVLIIVAAVGSIGYFGMTYWLSPGAPQPGSAPPAAAAPQTVALTTTAWTAADTALCKSKALAAVNAPLPDEMLLANRAVAEGFAGLATNVDCQLSTKAARFCDPREKAAMVAMINDYLARSDLVQLGLGLQGAPMAVMGGILGGEIAGGSAMYDEERDATLKFMAGYHKRVTADLQALARDGLVSPADFGGLLGMGVPQTVRTMFGDAQPQRNICA